MKKLLLALPLSILLLSTAQAQENQPDLIQGMFRQMTGQLQGKEADLADNPLLQALEAERQERRVSIESNTISRPVIDRDRWDREPISRPLR